MSEEKFTSEADKQVTVSFTIEENIRRDAWNWWDAVNKSSHGEKWIDRLPEQEREVLTEQCAGRTVTLPVK